MEISTTSTRRLKKEFFQRETLKVAENLIGSVLAVKDEKGNVLRGIINETEAYIEEDEASHSFNGKSNRNYVMFEEAGHCYVYLIYGMYFCANVVTEKENRGSAVLLRSLIPIEGKEYMKYRRKTDNEKILSNGPGKLCMAMGITREMNGVDLVNSGKIWIEEGVSPAKIKKKRRIGISKNTEVDWRFLGEF